jgi:hypothetical protein
MKNIFLIKKPGDSGDVPQRDIFLNYPLQISKECKQRVIDFIEVSPGQAVGSVLDYQQLASLNRLMRTFSRSG